MPAAVSTITQTGQVSIPKVIRDILGVGPRDQVEFLSDGERVQIVAVPKDPLTLGSKEEFWESIARADEDVAERRTRGLADVTQSLRSKHGL
jgi:AbrB family looped-hinge helix DNA binding protein